MASSLGLKAEAVSVSAELLPLVGDMAKAFALFDAIRKVFADVEIGEDFLRLTTIRQMADYLWPKVFGDTHADREITYFPLMHFQETLYFHRKGFVQNEPSGLSCYIYVNARMDGDFRADMEWVFPPSKLVCRFTTGLALASPLRCRKARVSRSRSPSVR